MITSDITINQSNNTTSLDFTAFSSMEENDYFELNVNNISIKLNVNANMSINDFTEWLANNCNNNYDFYSIATASNNDSALNITSKTSDQLNVEYDFNR
tara:strand:- start:9808 stop:10104 length:297 start_codon:yes stop_codon:yes gene_type:complete